MKSQTERYARASLVSAEVTVLLASIIHIPRFGHAAFVAGVLLGYAIWLLNNWFRRSGTKAVLVIYSLLNAWLIIGFGLVNGFWNHTVKVSLYYLHNESLPPFLARMFSNPVLGSSWYEGAGILLFVVAMVTAHTGYLWLKAMAAFRQSTHRDR